MFDFCNHLTLKRILCKLDQVMSHLNDFSTLVNSKLDAMDKAVDGLTGDVTFLKDQITKLSSSELDDEDKATVAAIEDRVSKMADRLTSLDEQTPSV